MWIRFDSRHRFAIKVHLGGVNAISGEPMDENTATKLRRLNSMANNKSIQDYVVTPDQLWLDGIASEDGCVRQFVAMPLGSGYSVEAQVTGKDVVGGLQFEITPTVSKTSGMKTPPSSAKGSTSTAATVFIKTLTGKTITLRDIFPGTLIGTVKDMIEAKEGIPVDQQNLVFVGKRLRDGESICSKELNIAIKLVNLDLCLADYNIPNLGQKA